MASFGTHVACDITQVMSRGKDSRNKHLLAVFGCVRQALLLDPSHICRQTAPSFQSTEGIAGLAPLAILEESLAEDKVFGKSGSHCCGRWLDKFMMRGDSGGLFWTVRSVEYFICEKKKKKLFLRELVGLLQI